MRSAALQPGRRAVAAAALGLSYARVSDNRKGKSTSVVEQLEENRLGADMESIPIGKELYDDDKSASEYSRDERPRYDEMIKELKTGRYGYLILWECSRGDREIERWIKLLKLCRELSVKIMITIDARIYDMSNPNDFKALIDAGSESMHASALTSFRVRRGVRKHAKKGMPYGRIPVGFERLYDMYTGELVEQRPDGTYSLIVREIYRRIDKGDSLSGIAKSMNDREIPTPGDVVRMRKDPETPRKYKWDHKTVRQVAEHAVNMGVREHHGEMMDGLWRPIVSPYLFWAVQRTLSDPSRKTTKGGKGKYLLTYIARCGECKAPLGRVPQTRGPETYQCTTGKRCVGVAITRLDDYVLGWLFERLALPDAFDYVTREDNKDVATARADVEKYRAELQELVAAWKAERISLTRFLDFEDDLNDKIRKAEKRAAVRRVPLAVRVLLDDDGRHLSIAERFAELDPAAQREAVRSVMEIELNRFSDEKRDSREELDDKRVTIRWRTPDPEPAPAELDGGAEAADALYGADVDVAYNLAS